MTVASSARDVNNSRYHAPSSISVETDIESRYYSYSHKFSTIIFIKYCSFSWTGSGKLNKNVLWLIILSLFERRNVSLEFSYANFFWKKWNRYYLLSVNFASTTRPIEIIDRGIKETSLAPCENDKVKRILIWSNEFVNTIKSILYSRKMQFIWCVNIKTMTGKSTM